MLRSFSFVELANMAMCGARVIKTLWRMVTKGRRRVIIVRLLLARPLWWLAAWLLAMPDAQTRYAEFRAKALARWEDILLGN